MYYRPRCPSWSSRHLWGLVRTNTWKDGQNFDYMVSFLPLSTICRPQNPWFSIFYKVLKAPVHLSDGCPLVNGMGSSIYPTTKIVVAGDPSILVWNHLSMNRAIKSSVMAVKPPLFSTFPLFTNTNSSSSQVWPELVAILPMLKLRPRFLLYTQQTDNVLEAELYTRLGMVNWLMIAVR